MTLFDYIYEWYSVHIFSTSGTASDVLDDVIVLQDTNTSLATWLSGTATIITMVILVVVLMLFVRWIFRLVSGLFLLR